MKPAEGSTVIGKSVTIRGEISGGEDLYVDGEIRGTVTLPESRFTVGPNSHVFADLEVRDVVILGSVEGNIRASGTVDIRQTATIHGDIYTSRLSIEEKAEIQGRVDLGSSTPSSMPPKLTTGGNAVPQSAPIPPLLSGK